MPLQKQNAAMNFTQGMETKSDPWQIPFGKFLLLRNIVFTVLGRTTKRNGYKELTALPTTGYTYISNFSRDLVAIGNRIQNYCVSSEFWSDKGFIQPLKMSVVSLIRSNTNQSQSDIAISSNGVVCTVYTDQDTSNLSNPQYKYVISDQDTGINIVSPTVISGADTTYGTPKVYLLGIYFVILYTSFSGGHYNLSYIAISTVSPFTVTSPVDISTSYTPSSTVNFDAAIFNNTLYIAWNGASASGIKVAYLASNLSLSASVIADNAHVATLMSVCTDSVNQVIWVSYYDLNTTTGFSLALSPTLHSVLAATSTIPSGTILNITSQASTGVLNLIYEVSNAYGYDGAIPTHYIKTNTLTQAGVLGTAAITLRSVGLASKAFVVNSTVYFLTVYQSSYQSTYFLSTLSGQLVAKLAYANGVGYLTQGLPFVNVSGTTAITTYLLKTTVQAVNKNTNVASGTQVAGIYSQKGVNLVNFVIGNTGINTAEIANNLNIPGGFLWMYDGNSAVEQGFHLWPDSVEVGTATGSGAIAADTYYYIATYEWSDDEGNLFRSAPSIPVSQVTTTSSSTNTIYVPTLRLTYKTANPVKIVLYRWALAQQVYYQVTSITTPTLNSLTVDYVTITDTSSNATILGNNILYTNGGVVENIGAPACNAVTLFDDRLFAITAEDPNLLAYSKQVLQATPIELSDLLTLYIAPSIGAEGSTGEVKAFSPMDDKLILFKANAIYYINGSGPDNTGSNSQYSQPNFVTSTVGSSNQNSIAFIPRGLMFQSTGKGIWLLGRDLSTKYIGAPVEAYNSAKVLDTNLIPETNFILFTLDTGVTLMYDYYVDQWGVFQGSPAISSTLYQGLHTTINSSGQVFQETPGVYLDGSNPISQGFITGWINLAGLQGYQRAYYFFLIGKYISPHLLQVGIAYDYADAPSQGFTIYPPNYNGPYGSDPTYGDSLYYGGVSSLEQFRLFFERQQCQSFQITVNELYDATLGVSAGEGITFSGLNMIYGKRLGYPKLAPSQSMG